MRLTNTWRTLAIALTLVTATVLSSCQKNNSYGRRTAGSPGKRSATTGASFSFKGDDSTQFFVARKAEQIPGPNLKLIQGGRAILGSQEEDVMAFRDNIERTVSISTFWMDETEMTNNDYKEFLFDMKKRISKDSLDKLEPSEKVWRGAMSFNDVYESYYFRFPGFNFYPVAGVSWSQADAYAKWRTEYAQKVVINDRKMDTTLTRSQLIELGVVIAEFRLPNEAEWEYAAKAMIGTQYLDENQEYGRIYPWDGPSMRQPFGRTRGQMLANYKRGRGDYSGLAGRSNDGAMITAEVYAYPANDFGLYNMAGNVAEWCEDAYADNSVALTWDLNTVNKDADEPRKVTRGGSWKDIAYYLETGTRAYELQNKKRSYIGFRCSMRYLGRPNMK